VTTGLLSAVGYLKDNRLLPSGFDKQPAVKDITVVDPDFTDKGSVIGTWSTPRPHPVRSMYAELWYQPMGFRWAHNLEPYRAAEPQRFVRHYES
jgi:hypothetical protein